jgi:hypothetical protein
MNSRFARAPKPPTYYEWCRSIIEILYPHPGDPWPPWFDAEIDYYFKAHDYDTVRVQGWLRLPGSGGVGNYQATLNRGPEGDQGSVQLRLTIGGTPPVATIGLTAYRGSYFAPQRADYNNPCPDPWRFQWQGPPWDFAPWPTDRDRVRIYPPLQL